MRPKLYVPLEGQNKQLKLHRIVTVESILQFSVTANGAQKSHHTSRAESKGQCCDVFMLLKS